MIAGKSPTDGTQHKSHPAVTISVLPKSLRPLVEDPNPVYPAANYVLQPRKRDPECYAQVFFVGPVDGQVLNLDDCTSVLILDGFSTLGLIVYSRPNKVNTA